MKLLLLARFRTSEEAVWGLLSSHGLADRLGKAPPFCLVPNGSSASCRLFCWLIFFLIFVNLYF